MYIEIGAFDAKSKLSHLLHEVSQGRCYTITLRGKAIADLVPSESARHPNIQVAMDEMHKIRKVKGVSPESLKTWMTEGRR